MDSQSISLARAVKQRTRTAIPTIWLFTDQTRFPDPLAAIARLPPAISGVIFRHDHAPDRPALARRVAALCRSRRIVLIIAGDWRLAATHRAGLHLRRGQSPRTSYRTALTTASAHNRREIVAACRAGASLIFLSPAFATHSHPETPPLGPIRWAALARQSPIPVLALGGITARRPRRLGPHCAGFGATKL